VKFILVGVNHRSAPLAERERLHFPPPEVGAALERLRHRPGIEECCLLSTCNRTEVLAAASADGDAAAREVVGFLADERAFDRAALDRIVYIKTAREAVRHLFRLGIGLDSMILGEPQILGQVKQAYAAAAAAGTLGARLQALMQRALAVAKKVRTTTAVGRNPVSVSYAAVDLAHQIFGDLAERSILILGAGKTAELCARHLVGSGVRAILVANRTFQRAHSLAQAFGGEAVPFDRFLEYLERVDVVVASTSAPHAVLRYDDAVKVIRRRRNRPLFLIDLAVPRDVEPAVNRIDNIYLYDIDDLQQVAEAGRAERREAAAEAEACVEAEVAAYEAWAQAQDLSPTIVALRDKLLDLRAAELTRFDGRLQDLGPDQRQVVEELTAALINKILHGPIQHLKRAAAAANGSDRVSLVRQLFGLPEQDATAATEVRAPETEDPEADEPGAGRGSADPLDL